MNKPLPMSSEQPLFLTEIFASVQGETSFTGLPTTFVRLSACNLRCTWCDTTYSFKRGSPMLPSAILQKIKEFSCHTVCITGGEPLLQQSVLSLMTQICDEGYTVTLETGGSLPIDAVDPRVHVILDIKCPGSGMSEKNHWDNLKAIKPKDEIKFVLLDRNDYDWAVKVIHQHNLSSLTPHLLLSPVFGKLDPQELVKWILEDRLPVRLNMQLHKFIWTPETKGV